LTFAYYRDYCILTKSDYRENTDSSSTLTKSDPLFTKITDPFDVCLTLRQPPGNDFG